MVEAVRAVVRCSHSGSRRLKAILGRLPDLSKALHKAPLALKRQVFEAFCPQSATTRSSGGSRSPRPSARRSRRRSRRRRPPAGGLSRQSKGHSGGGIRTRDLRVMSPTSYLTAPPRGVPVIIEGSTLRSGSRRPCRRDLKEISKGGKISPVLPVWWVRELETYPDTITKGSKNGLPELVRLKKVTGDAPSGRQPGGVSRFPASRGATRPIESAAGARAADAGVRRAPPRGAPAAPGGRAPARAGARCGRSPRRGSRAGAPPRRRGAIHRAGRRGRARPRRSSLSSSSETPSRSFRRRSSRRRSTSASVYRRCRPLSRSPDAGSSPISS